MISVPPTTATTNGSEPLRIAGSTNWVSTSPVTANAPSAASPRQRDSATTAMANTIASTSSGRPRSWSTYW